MLNPYDAYEHTYGPGGRPRPEDEEGDNDHQAVGPMRRALAHISPRLALGVFLSCWIATQVWAILAWANGEPTPMLITHWLLLPALAGVLVGWWRGGIAGTMAGGGASLLVVLANAAVVLLWWRHDSGESSGGDWDLLELVATLAFLLGLLGGAIGAAAHSPKNP